MRPNGVASLLLQQFPQSRGEKTVPGKTRYRERIVKDCGGLQEVSSLAMKKINSPCPSVSQVVLTMTLSVEVIWRG
jgi:hypothetical protein